MKHKHIPAGAKYVKPWINAPVYPNGFYGVLVEMCIKCGKEIIEKPAHSQAEGTRK